jgi:hypothetical protein
MLDLSTDQQAALAARSVMRRFFIWVDALDLDGTPDPAGFWDDVGTIDHDLRTYYGSGGLIQISTLAAKSDMSIPGLSVTLSGISLEANDLVRARLLAQRPISVSMGIFDPADHALIGSLIPRFVGKIDDIEIATPEAGGKNIITLTCESTSRALTIKRTDTRSQSTLSQRRANDGFYNFTAGQATKAIYFGRQGP